MTGATNPTHTATTATDVRVKVEVYGVPRLRSGVRDVEVRVPSPCRRRNLVAALAEQCPALVGNAIRPDLSDLEEGYTFNLNGLAFLGEGSFTVAEGDALLLISSQAGG